MCKCSWRKNEPLLPWALLTVWNVNPPVKQGALLTQLMRNSLFKLQAGQLVVIWRKERNLAEKQLGAFSQVSRRQWGPMVVYATRLMDPLWGDKSRVREGSGSDSWRGMRGSAIWQSGEMGRGGVLEVEVFDTRRRLSWCWQIPLWGRISGGGWWKD